MSSFSASPSSHAHPHADSPAPQAPSSNGSPSSGPGRRGGAGPLLVLAAAALWGTTGTAASFAPASASPLSTGAATMGVGGLLTFVLAGRSALRVLHAGRPVALWALLGGVAVAVYPLAFYSSMDRAGVATGTVVTIGCSPVFAALMERLLVGVRLTPRWLAATLCAATGCALLALTAGGGSQGGHDVPGGVALGLLSGAAYAVFACYGARIIRAGHTSRAAMGSLFGLGALVLLPVLALTGGPLLSAPRGVLVAAYLAVVPMCVAYVLFGAGLARVTAGTATTLSLFEPVVAAALGVAVVGERLGGWAWTGTGLVLLGLLVLTVPVRKPGLRRSARGKVPGRADGSPAADR
ncbi:DMT family transporter [Streptomyces sp. WMMB 322]|uniref:DMT family transporter n=1 Tax=Streptomyces sp. WMMB 322 TaxID=1286821 RepID=UPI000823D389|nr:EamA family transporter [Streptomyces sp. WMMB 322]SCK56688.1 drug/metabolite transporter, DME family [Streptomyces sp. WMMB 322]